MRALEQDGLSRYLYNGTQFKWGKAAIRKDAHQAFFRLGKSTQPPYGISDFELEKCQNMYTFKEVEYKIESPDGKYNHLFTKSTGSQCLGSTLHIENTVNHLN